MKIAALAGLLLLPIGSACFDLGERHGVAIEVRSVEYMRPGITDLAQASELLGHAPCQLTHAEDGGTCAAWWSYLGDDGAQSLRITEYMVVAHFDAAQKLVSVSAADYRRKDYWYYPDCDHFMAEIESSPQPQN